MNQEKKSSGKKILLIITGVIVLAIAAVVIPPAYKAYKLINSEEFRHFEEKQQKLGDEIVYYVDQDMLTVNVYDPGSSEWEPVIGSCTEELQSGDADFDGFHFVTAAGHDEGEGWFVMSKTEEGSGEPSQYAVFRLEMKDHKITAVTDAQLADQLENFDFH